MVLRTMSRQTDYHTEVHTIGASRVRIEITRMGLLWRGHAALVNGSIISRDPLAVCWGTSYNQVFEDVLNGAHQSLDD